MRTPEKNDAARAEAVSLPGICLAVSQYQELTDHALLAYHSDCCYNHRLTCY